MLGKLLKYEFIATGRILLLVYAAVIAVAALTSLVGVLFESVEVPEWIGTVLVLPLSMVGLLAFGALFIVPLIVIIVRFYRSFLMAEGHLMFTLPVTRHQLILSKLLTAAVWYVTTWIVAAASAVIIFAGWIPADFWAENMWIFNAAFAEFTRNFDQGGLMLALYLVSMVIGAFSAPLMIYLAMALGQLANAHRVLLSIVAWLALIVSTFVVTIILTLPMSIASDLGSNAGNMSFSQETVLSLVVSNILSLVLAAAMYFTTEYLLRKRLNLL